MLAESIILEALSYAPETGEIRWKNHRSSNAKAGDLAGGGITKRGYHEIRLAGKRCYAHRLAWFLSYGSWPLGQIDHINGVKTDNRLVNLRLATTAENLRNRGRTKNNTSGFKGVTWSRSKRKWVAQIKKDYRGHFLGYFDTPEEAGAAYRTAAIKHHGNFAVSR